MASFFKKIGKALKPIAAIGAGFIPGVGPQISAAIGASLAAKEAKAQEKAQLRAIAAAGGGGAAVDTTRGVISAPGGGGMFGSLVGGPPGAVAGGGVADASERERVAQLAGFVLNGALDQAVKAKARELRVTRAVWNRNVSEVLAVPVINAQTGQWGYYNWTTTDRMAVANEVDAILRAKRKRGLIPRWLKKQAKINKALKGLMGSVAAVKFKSKKRA